MTEARCRSGRCGAPIVWAVTRTGKRLPVDADPHPGGNVTLTVGPDGTVTADVLGPLERTVADGPLHHAHFTTCVAADEFRRSR